MFLIVLPTHTILHLFLAGYNCINLYRFMFTLITTLVNGNFNNCVVIRPLVFIFPQSLWKGAFLTELTVAHSV
jgi:hypothetical protein